MAFNSPGQVLQGKFSRRSFMKTTAAGIATGAMGSASFLRIARSGGRAAKHRPWRQRDQRDPGTGDEGLWLPAAGEASKYVDMFSKMLNQYDQAEIAEGYFNDMRRHGAGEGLAAHRHQETEGLG